MPLADTVAAQPTPPRLLLVGFGPYASPDDNGAGRVVQRLVDQAWSPQGARLIGCTAPVSWRRAAGEVISAVAAHGCDAILLVATRARASDLRVEMRAQNRVAPRRPDADGMVWPHDRILPTGPGIARATAPVAEMVQAMTRAGIKARASSECGDYIGNFVLYRLLTDPDLDTAARPVGCLSAPRKVDIEDLERAVKVAVGAFAERLLAHHAAPATV